MKKIFSYITSACLLVVTIQACKLTDVTDLKPQYKLDENTVVTDIPSAENLLAGAYYVLRMDGMAASIPYHTSLMGLNVSTADPAASVFVNNTVPTDNRELNEVIYGSPYEMIQTANWVIEKTGKLTTTVARKAEIIAEAKFLRALGHFYILRLFGQFWDSNSLYGIEIRSQSILPIAERATVKASYDFILADLDEAIKFCPQYVTGATVKKGYATKLAAKALKSRVLLYKKDYSEAALLAKDVMAGPAVLSNDFLNMFIRDKYYSNEVILASITFYKNTTPYGDSYKLTFWNTYNAGSLSPRYIDLLANDARKTIVTPPDPDYPDEPVLNGKFSVGVDDGWNDTEYYFRLAEAYLIYAEAEVRRVGGSLSDAQNAVNALRIKRGVLPVSASDKTELLALIRREKELELGAESGEDWFDIVRYIKNKDVEAGTVKLSLRDENKLILPVPQVSIDAAGGLLKQNPGY